VIVVEVMIQLPSHGRELKQLRVILYVVAI
jgi:hypothetical protein